MVRGPLSAVLVSAQGQSIVEQQLLMMLLASGEMIVRLVETM